MSAEQVALSAQALVGVPFRMHGRESETGLDCVGLVGAALAGAGYPIDLPLGYGLRNRTIESYLAIALATGLRTAALPGGRGSAVLFHIGRAQHHLAISLGGNRLVHAHAGLRRVVESDADPAWTPVRAWHHPLSRKD